MGHTPKNYKRNPNGIWHPGDPLTEEDLALLRPVKQIAMKRGHTPHLMDVPNSKRLKNRFNSWKDVLKAAGLPSYTEPEQAILRKMAAENCSPFAFYDDEILQISHDAGFSAAALISTSEIVFEPSFRTFCAENRCGCYGANYSCPPDCGTPDEMKDRICAYDRALVLQTKWNIRDYSDIAAIKKAKRSHNTAMLSIVQKMQSNGMDGLMAGASCCLLCEHCAILQGEPCRFPSRRYSCLSAYCIYVKKLAERCNMEYCCSDGKLALFGLYAFQS